MSSAFSAFWAFLKSPEGASVTTALSTIVLTLTTMVYAWLTYVLAKENKLLRKAGTEPEVVAYLGFHPRIFGALHFILANVGQGPALNVAFRIVSGGDDFGKHKARFPRPQMPLTVIPQGERYESFFGLSWEMFSEPRLLPFSVEVKYLDLKRRQHSRVFPIDIAQFEGYGSVGKDPQEALVEATKAIVAEMQKWSSHGLPVETFTRAERRQEEHEWREQMRAQQEQSENPPPSEG